MKLNPNFDKLKRAFLFDEVARRAAAYQEKHPEKTLIRISIGDVTQPIPAVAVTAMKNAAEEMGHRETFRGYLPYGGCDFLREAISGYYASFGVEVHPNEILVNDGAKSDCANIVELFSTECLVQMADPIYPVYVDSNILAGREIHRLPAGEEQGFMAMPDPEVHADIIYLCSPNNPTGAVYTREQLEAWVDYALKNEAIILYDSAYEAFITDPALPRSIFAVPGARKCAIELNSLSKMAGFTGVRCGYTVVPHDLELEGHRLYDLWFRRLSTKYNGVSYPVQRAAEAVYTEEGQAQVKKTLDYYRENARILMSALDDVGITYTGGKHAPYIWLHCPGGMDSWTFFDYLLENAGVIATPGEGFGASGRNYCRITAFSSRENTQEAADRIRAALKDLK